MNPEIYGLESRITPASFVITSEYR